MELSERKRALLERLRAGAGQGDGAVTIPRLHAQAPRHLSSAQLRILFVDQLYPEARFNGSLVLEHDGVLDLALLRRALNLVVERHEVLRTNASLGPQGPIAVVRPPSETPVAVADLRELSSEFRETEALRLARAKVQQSIDIYQQSPLLNALVLLMEPERSLIVLSLSMFAFDGPSGVLFAREVIGAYVALSAGRSPESPEPPYQYADYTAWERTQAPPGAPASLDYWVRRLAGTDEELQLPTDKARVRSPSMAAIRYSFKIPPPLATALKELARRSGVTFYMVLLAGLQVLLYRHTPSASLSIGAWTARRDSQTAHLLGPLVNTLVYQVNLSDTDELSEVIRKVRQTSGSVHAHAHVPFEHVVAAVAPQRRIDLNPLFQVHFILQDTGEQSAMGGFRLSALDSEVGAAGGYDIELIMRDLDRGVEGHFECSEQLFDREGAERIAERFSQVLSAMAANPTQRVGEIGFQGGAQQPAEMAAELDLALELSRLGECEPDAVAVIEHERAYTFSELAAEVDALQRRLTSLGQEDLLGLVCGAGFSHCVGMIAALRAGVPFTSLGPHPAVADLQRISVGGRLRLYFGAEVASDHKALLASVWDEIDQGAASDQSARVSRPAYLVETSGSTGEPNLARISREALANLIGAVRQAYRLGKGSRALVSSQPRFDVLIEETIPTLLSGGTVVVGDLDGGPQTLTRLIEDHNATMVNLSGSLWQAWITSLSDLGRPLPASLDLVVVGSEPVDIEWARRWRALFGDKVRLLHAYGVAEAAVTSALFELPDDEKLACLPRLPIGRPLPGVRLEVVDLVGRGVAPGVVGELCISAPGIGPEIGSLDERLFNRDGVWWLRTGDLGRARFDGDFEFLGRSGRAQKVRGRMAHPDRLEELAAAHPSVSAAKITVETGLSPLVALRIWPRQGVGALDYEKLRSEMKDLFESRCGQSAGVDRVDIVGEPPSARMSKFSDGELGALERALVELWTAVAAVDVIDLDADVFLRGVTSFTCLNFAGAARQAGIQIGVRDVYEAPTIRGQAARVFAALALQRPRERRLSYLV